MAIAMATRKVRLTDALREVTAALTLLDAEALERLSTRLTALASGVAAGATGVDAVIEREPVEVILARQRVLASVLAATAENLKVLERIEGFDDSAMSSRERSRLAARKVRTEWVP